MSASPTFYITKDEAAQRDALLAQKYYLVRQGSIGEIFRCKRCNGKHQYMTLMCVERPYSGLIEGLIAFYKVLGDPTAYLRMKPQEQVRVDQVGRVLGALGHIPSLASSHPMLARAQGVSSPDIEIGSVALGIMVEVDAKMAQRLQTKINAKGLKPKLALPGLR